MKGCKHIRKLIDEAQKPDVLSFAVTEHIGRCSECERFANERVALRRLMGSGKRVSAPVNFDAMLKARLAEVKAQRSFSWLSPTGYLRLGAATAGLVVMIFAAQYAGLFSDQSRPGTESQVSVTTPAPAPAPPRSGVASLPPTLTGPTPSDRLLTYSSGQPSRSRRGFTALGRRIASDGYLTAEDRGVVLVRGENGDIDVPMPTVSVGAQPLVYVSAGQRGARTVGTSF